MLADTSIEMVLKMPFLSLSNANVKFAELEKLTYRSYITTKALANISWVKLIDKKEFAKAILDENFETFVMHIATQEARIIRLFQAAQIAAL